MLRHPMLEVTPDMITDLRNLMTPETKHDWWEDCGNIAALLRWLNERDELGDIEDVIYLVSKPWKWDEEYRQMKALHPEIGTGA